MGETLSREDRINNDAEWVFQLMAELNQAAGAYCLDLPPGMPEREWRLIWRILDRTSERPATRRDERLMAGIVAGLERMRRGLPYHPQPDGRQQLEMW